MRKKDVHLFLWPQNALGSPVMMRRAPNTPKAGVILVARMMGVGVGEGEDVGVDEFAWMVLVALYTVGNTVVIVVAMFPEWLTDVNV